jgi:hypothetical protein
MEVKQKKGSGHIGHYTIDDDVAALIEEGGAWLKQAVATWLGRRLGINSEVIAFRLGFFGIEPQTRKNTAWWLRTSEEAVRQIEYIEIPRVLACIAAIKQGFPLPIIPDMKRNSRWPAELIGSESSGDPTVTPRPKPSLHNYGEWCERAALLAAKPVDQLAA